MILMMVVVMMMKEEKEFGKREKTLVYRRKKKNQYNLGTEEESSVNERFMFGHLHKCQEHSWDGEEDISR